MIRPMLATAIEPDYFDKLRYPVLASIKLDGIRCILTKDGAFSRSGKLIPNKFIQEYLTNYFKENCVEYGFTVLDGELLVGENFQNCTSGIMSFTGQPDFTFNVFDCVAGNEFLALATERALFLEDFLPLFPHIILHQQDIIDTEENLVKYYTKAIEEQHEGIILRSINSPYKQGRSTLKEQYLLKIKPFKSAEAKIIGFIEQLHNDNDLKEDELGYAERSSSKENMIPMDTLGAFVVKDLVTGLEFNIGTGKGLTQELRKKIWNNKEEYLNKIITYKYQEIGTKDLPRTPIFHGFRDKEDL